MPTQTTWRSVMLVRTCLQINEKDLLDYLDLSTQEGADRAIRFLTANESRDWFWLALFTRLANYTSMNQILIDHVRSLMRRLPASDLTQDEAERRQVLAEQPVTRFLKDLRNYITHHTVPPLTMVTTKDERGVRFAAELPSDDLLESHDWSAGAKQYILSTNSVNLAVAVIQFRAVQDDYYAWLFAQRSTLAGQLGA